MPLYVITPPDPPVGADWQATVPGQYLYDVVGITATLDTGGSPDLPTDISGNGNNGTYVNAYPSTMFIPGALTGNDGLVAGTLTPKNARTGFTIPPAGMPFTGDFTLVWWEMNARTGGDTAHDLVAYDGANAAVFGARVNSGGNMQVFFNAGGSWTSFNTMPTNDNIWHMLAVAYDAGTQMATLYCDGAAIPIFGGGTAGGPLGAPPVTIRWGLAFTGAPGMIGNTDELAYVPSTLSAGDIATLFGAAPVFAAYEAAQLSVVPLTYYHLDGVVSGGGGRQVTLEVTNGTDTLQLVPSGFTESASGGPFHYSWQPKLAASSQTTDGLTTTVAIPQLTIPAGYTIGARTLDLSGGDQWSDVNIWWDSTLMDALDPARQYEFPPGFKLLYQQDVTIPVGQWRVK